MRYEEEAVESPRRQAAPLPLFTRTECLEAAEGREYRVQGGTSDRGQPFVDFKSELAF